MRLSNWRGEISCRYLDIAQKIGAAQRRLLIASMDISSGTILGAINDSIARSGLTVDGISDRTQMEGVIKDWERSGSQQSLAKEQLFRAIAPHFHSKKSTPIHRRCRTTTCTTSWPSSTTP
jgi:hypothetical protein